MFLYYKNLYEILKKYLLFENIYYLRIMHILYIIQQ